MTRKEQVLRWVNRQRANEGKAPLDALPRGYRHTPTSCTIANALERSIYKVSGGGYYVAIKSSLMRDSEIPMPAYVKSFVRAFDQGRYPELIAK